MSEGVFKETPIPEFRLFQEKFPDLSESLIELIRQVFDESNLERKIQELVLIGLLASNRFENGCKFHIREALKQGATRKEILGVLLLLLPYCDISSFLKSLTWAKEEGI